MKCLRCSKAFEADVSLEVCNVCLGVEKIDPVPLALPLGYSHPPTIQEMIDQSIRAASRAASDQDFDTLEDADDMGEDEERHELPDNSKYTLMEDDEPFHVLKDREKKALALEKEERENKAKRSDNDVRSDRRSKFREPALNRRERREREDRSQRHFHSRRRSDNAQVET